MKNREKDGRKQLTWNRTGRQQQADTKREEGAVSMGSMGLTGSLVGWAPRRPIPLCFSVRLWCIEGILLAAMLQSSSLTPHSSVILRVSALPLCSATVRSPVLIYNMMNNSEITCDTALQPSAGVILSWYRESSLSMESLFHSVTMINNMNVNVSQFGQTGAVQFHILWWRADIWKHDS